MITSPLPLLNPSRTGDVIVPPILGFDSLFFSSVFPHRRVFGSSAAIEAPSAASTAILSIMNVIVIDIDGRGRDRTVCGASTTATTATITSTSTSTAAAGAHREGRRASGADAVVWHSAPTSDAENAASRVAHG